MLKIYTNHPGGIPVHNHKAIKFDVPEGEQPAKECIKSAEQTKTSRKIDFFYRYGDHVELIRFKEYYRMPRGQEHISFVFSSAFRAIFS